jgi:WXG100 family type VII secretion target
MSTAQLRAQLEGLTHAANRLDSLHKAEIVGIVSDLRQIEQRLSGSWSGPASEAYSAAHGGWLAALEARGRDLTLQAGLLRAVATGYRETDAALAQAAEEHDASRHRNGASHGPSDPARVGSGDGDIPPWQQAGFGWWAEAFAREHGRPPTTADYDEFRLSWELSGQGAIAWTAEDWRALYEARQEGLADWMMVGRIHGPLSGVAVLAEVNALNRARDVQALIDRGDYRTVLSTVVSAYHLDAIAGVPIVYDPMHVGDNTYAQFDALTNTIRVGPDAFSAQASSPDELASIIGHELVHARQYEDARLYAEYLPGRYLNEVEAWRWELDHATQNHLSPAEIGEIQRTLALYYNALPPDLRALADQNVYVIPGVPAYATPTP